MKVSSIQEFSHFAEDLELEKKKRKKFTI